MSDVPKLKSSKRNKNRKTAAMGSFDPAAFLQTAATGRTISTHKKKGIIFEQGDGQIRSSISNRAKSKSPSYPRKAMRLLLRSLEKMNFWVKDVLSGSRSAWQLHLQ